MVQMQLRDLVPYWSGMTDDCVSNSISLGGSVWLLTGANMAGKDQCEGQCEGDQCGDQCEDQPEDQCEYQCDNM